MRTFTTLIAAAALLVAVAMPASSVAQDPADGWMAYAVGTTPAGTERITFMQMKWVVSNNAQSSFAFYSPWFGMVRCRRTPQRAGAATRMAATVTGVHACVVLQYAAIHSIPSLRDTAPPPMLQSQHHTARMPACRTPRTT